VGRNPWVPPEKAPNKVTSWTSCPTSIAVLFMTAVPIGIELGAVCAEYSRGHTEIGNVRRTNETSFEFEILVTSSLQSPNLSNFCEMTRLVTQKMRYPVIVHYYR
jgi:hypothetical protein